MAKWTAFENAAAASKLLSPAVETHLLLLSRGRGGKRRRRRRRGYKSQFKYFQYQFRQDSGNNSNRITQRALVALQN